jgi:hypothetical protein
MVWMVVTTDPGGFDDYVWINTLIQCLKLGVGESPFYAQYGIPAQQSVIQQVFPDFYVARTQAQFSRYFASLIIAKLANTEPEYNVNITTNQGARVQFNVLDGGNFPPDTRWNDFNWDQALWS